MGAYLSETRFTFTSKALDKNTFGVVNFTGFEGFSTCYEFDIHLVSDQKDIDLGKVLAEAATFAILRPEGDIPFHGILTDFEQMNEVNDYVFYRARLVPKLWWLSLTKHNQIFLNKDLPGLLDQVLKDGGLTSNDFELRLQESYPEWEYLCQYRESHLAFVCRWMERDGLYFFFEQGDQGEKVVVTDTGISHTAMDAGKDVSYSPVSGLDDDHREEVVKALVCKQKLLPKTVQVMDYHYDTPSLGISAEAQVSSQGRGTVHIYGEHLRTNSEAQTIAGVRAEELLCQEKRFHCESTIPFIRPGYLFDLERHYRNDYNQSYLTVEVHHSGSQTAYLIAGIQEGLSSLEKEPYYRNTFVAIPSGTQYRHPKETPPPRFYGTINAKIDAAGSGQYAELDDQGRYKVLLPFDLSGRKDGKASHYIRMAQPYAGADHGMHMPLHKGTEVFLVFEEGDPDRPVIAGAAPNPETPSPVTSDNQTKNVLRTAGGNLLEMDDLADAQRILLSQACGNALTLSGTKGTESVTLDSVGGHKVLLDGTRDKEAIRITDKSGNEILLDPVENNGPKVRFSQTNGHEIIIQGKEGEEIITVRDCSGNEIVLQGVDSDESIKLTDRGGNEIHMRGASGQEAITLTDKSGNTMELSAKPGQEGIKLTDNYGNLIHLDAEEKYMRLFSPSHNSGIEIGRSLKYTTDSDSKQLISADASFTCIGASSDIFMGAKNGMFLGAKADISIGLAFVFNAAVALEICGGFKGAIGFGSTYIKESTGWWLQAPALTLCGNTLWCDTTSLKIKI